MSKQYVCSQSMFFFTKLCLSSKKTFHKKLKIKKSPKLFVYLCQIVTNLQNSKRDKTKNSNYEEKKLKKSNCDKTQTSPFWKQTKKYIDHFYVSS